MNSNTRAVRLAVAAALACASGMAALATPAAALADPVKFDIAAQPLPRALNSFAEQANMQLLYRYDAVSRAVAHPVHGLLETHAALSELLLGTGLTAIYAGEHVATIRPATDLRKDPPTKEADQPARSRRPRTATPTHEPKAPASDPSASRQRASSSEAAVLQEVVVTGTTLKHQTVLESSSDIIPISSSQLSLKAPRNTDEVLEEIPTMFVEDTAGPESNNYSVRGLPGGAQSFVNFEQDGLPIAYPGTGNPDELFSYDINVKEVQAVLGGDSGILTPNAAGAAVNFITRKPDFHETKAIVELTVATYNKRRVDAYYSAPITHDLAFNIGGYFSTDHGQRDAGFTYASYHVKADIERRFDRGGYVLLSGEFGLRHDPYYADMPFRDVNGVISSVPGFPGQTANVAGPAFGDIEIPASCYASSTPQGCYRDFSLRRGIVVGTHQVRLDFDIPVTQDVDVFGKAHLLHFGWDFNGIFPGSGTGNAGLATAYNYLNGGSTSPIASLLTAGAQAFPGATFGIQNLATGQIISSTDSAALNALNGNGLLQQTALNQQDISGRDLATNVGARWDWQNDLIRNSLTVGAMYFDDNRHNNQSATGGSVINGVIPQSPIYDVVALNPSGRVIGTLTDHGMVSIGSWGEGIWNDDFGSFSEYFNDELQLSKHWHFEFGAREERIVDHYYQGNAGSAAAPVPVGSVGSSILTVPQWSAFNGTYTESTVSHSKAAESFGINYTFNSNLALYFQYENGFQMNAGGGSPSPSPTSVRLYEVGARYGNPYVFATAGVYQTNLLNQSTGCFDPSNPSFSCNAFYDVRSRGIEYQFKIEPVALLDHSGDYLSRAFSIQWFGVFQDPRLANVLAIEYNNGVVAIPSHSFPEFDGNVDNRTPRSMQTLEGDFQLPRHLGVLYVRGRYQGSFYADVANQLELPGYWTLSAGVVWYATPHLTVNVSGRNLTDNLGLTEGNPRQGVFTQTVVNSTFYGRSIFGREGQLTLKYRF